MGIDLRTIIGHKLSIDEIINFPDFLNKNLELKQIFLKKEQKINQCLSKIFISKTVDIKSDWEEITKEDILKSWANNITSKLLDEVGYICCTLSTYFGLVTFNQQTITILYIPESKYSNMFNNLERDYIFEFSETLAKILEQKKVIYCSDTYSTEQIESWSYQGLAIEDIEKLAIEKFGYPPNDIEQAIENRFVIKII